MPFFLHYGTIRHLEELASFADTPRFPYASFSTIISPIFSLSGWRSFVVDAP